MAHHSAANTATGRENAADYLVNNPDVAAEVEKAIRVKIEEARAAKGDVPVPDSGDLADGDPLDDPDALTFPDEDGESGPLEDL